MKRIAALLVALYAMQCSAADSGTYLSCVGYSGVAHHQTMVALLSREITEDKSQVKGSVYISADKVVIDGIPFLAATYKICQNTDQSAWFSPSGDPKYCADNDKFNDLGVINKVTGEIHYHAGDLLFILNCKKASKIVP